MKKALILVYILLGACAPKEHVIYKKVEYTNPIVTPQVIVTCFNKHGNIIGSYSGLIDGDVFETKKGNCVLDIEY